MDRDESKSETDNEKISSESEDVDVEDVASEDEVEITK